MKQTMKKTLAFLLVLVQLFVLFPALQPQAKAVQTESTAVPVLNKTIVGTVKFQSFNFLGDNDNGSDGVDYTSTFVYTDDYFASSAINTTAESTTSDWDKLTSNELSLAACSIDFAVASMTSAEGDVLTASTQTWNNSDYSDKDKNVIDFLSKCGFSNIEPSATMRVRPTNDSIAYTIASKPITVWDETDRANKTYTLVAVGVRGAGYGQEWASNVTIGTPGNGSSVVRHKGFDDGAQTVCEAVRAYLSAHGITENVKYWVTGFSRAAAVANLAAGYITDAPAVYHTSGRPDAGSPDVYAYTWECPQAASTSENALRYRNIHNILNAMDAVPKVSPGSFNHQRLGIDYRMPYHGNTTEGQNETFYLRMRDALQTIAVGAYNYGGKSYQEDPLIGYTDPSQYPYNRTMTVRTITATQLIADAVGGSLMDNFGTVNATGSNRKITPKYIDQFLDDLIDVFLVSKAWVGDIGSGRTPIQNRTTFINNFQNDIRNVLGYLLDYSGPAFLVLVDKLIGGVGDQLSLSNLFDNGGLALAFTNFYTDPTGSYSRLNFLVGDWRGQPKRTVLISEAQPVVKNVIKNMVGSSFRDPQGISESTFNSSLDHLVELVVNLYADELSRFNSNYFGTTLYYMWQILSVHEQETVMSWIKSLDDNFISDVRKITLPGNADIDMYVFREGMEGALSASASDAVDAHGALVASVRSGAFVPLTGADGKTYDRLDDRITLTQSGGNVVITYPGTIDLRFDVQGNDADLGLQLTDLQPKNTVNTKSTATRDSKGHITATQIVTDSMTQQDNTPTASAINTFSNGNAIDLAAGEALSVIAWHGSNQVLNAKDASYALYKTTQKTVVADFGSIVTSKNATLKEGSSSSNGVFAPSGNDVVYQLYAAKSGANTTLNDAFTAVDTARTDLQSIGLLQRGEKLTVVPASSVYYDDDLAGQSFTSDGHGYSADIVDAMVSTNAQATDGTFYYTFYGSGIDAYCTTDDESGYVSAAVFRGAGADACVKANRVGSAQTVSGQTAGAPKYNTPTISFMDLGGQDTYTLKIVANNSAKFKLDGVRVYHPVQADSAAAEAQAEAGEGNVLYLNLHELLLNADQGFSVQPITGMDEEFDKSTVSGVLFIDNADALVTESHYDADGEWHEEMTQLYATQFEAYRANSPKNEIYLSSDQAITFQVNTDKAPAGSTIYIGMSAPETGSGEVSVTGSGSKPVTSVMDMYYGVTVPTNGLITITNAGESLISLTNLKIPNVPEAKSVSAMPAPEKIFAMRAFFAPVTTETVELAAAQETETVTVQPDPTSPPIGDLISQLISSFVQNLFSSISRLFRL